MSYYNLTYCPIETPENIPTIEFPDMPSLIDYIYENSSDQAVFVYWELAIEDNNQHNNHRKLCISCTYEDVVEYFMSLDMKEFDLNVFEFETYREALDYCSDMWDGVTKYYDTHSIVEDLSKHLNSEGAKPSQA